MLKPDFGNVDRRIEWNADRIAWVRHLAGQQRTAIEIAVDIGLAANQAPRIYELCKRCNIALTGQGGRPKRDDDAAVVYRVAIKGSNSALLARIAKRHGIYPGRVAEILLNAVFETGEPFAENLLDLDAGS